MAPFNPYVNRNSLPLSGGTLSGDLVFSQDNPEIRGGDTDGIFHITAGTTNALGANILLHGDTETDAGDFEIRDDTTNVIAYDASANTLTLTEGTIAVTGILTVSSTSVFSDAMQVGGALSFTQANPEILGADSNGVFTIGPSTSNAVGGIVKLYGQVHASLASDIEFLADTTQVGLWDESADDWKWTCTSFDITGILTVSGNATLGDAATDLLTCNGDITIVGDVIRMANIVTSDPSSAGQLYSNSGVVTVSAG